MQQVASVGASISDAIIQQSRQFAASVGQQPAAGSMQNVAMPALPPQLISGIDGIIHGLDTSMGQVGPDAFS
jgi:hypothetical protein